MGMKKKQRANTALNFKSFCGISPRGTRTRSYDWIISVTNTSAGRSAWTWHTISTLGGYSPSVNELEDQQGVLSVVET